MSGVVLALDLATCTGWCVGAADSRPAYGSVRLEGRERAARYGALLDWLDDAVRLWKPDRLVCEAPMVSGDFAGRDAALLALGLAAHVEFWAWDNGVQQMQSVVVGTARKGVLGKGGFAKGTAKAVVMDWARREGFSPGDDNAADALLLWAYATGYRRQREMAA
jgi:crossover junction endodeoxyribonuclease RuvC